MTLSPTMTREPGHRSESYCLRLICGKMRVEVLVSPRIHSAYFRYVIVDKKEVKTRPDQETAGFD